MSWSFAMVLLPTLCYAATAVLEFRQDKQTALIFAGYALANLGFLWKFWR